MKEFIYSIESKEKFEFRINWSQKGLKWCLTRIDEKHPFIDAIYLNSEIGFLDNQLSTGLGGGNTN
jgi:hypothetical protein